MTRVIYNFDSWDRPPRKVQMAEQLVRASRYHYGNPLLTAQQMIERAMP